MASPVLQFKRGILSNLPGLRAGEPGFTTDSYDLYVGLTSETATNKFFGSHRYWTKETTSTGSGVNLVEGTSNGADFITLKSPSALSGITTYTLPATPTDGYYLKTNSTGDLSWGQVVSTFDINADSGTKDTVSTGSTITFTGGTNVNTAVTDDTITINLDDSPSVTNLNVSGITTLAGNVNLGDATEDVITVVGVATFTTSNVYISNQLYVGGFEVNGGTSVGLDITTRNLSVTGVSTFTGAIDANGGADINGTVTVGAGVGITQFTSAVGSGTSTSSVPTSSAVIDYVDSEIGLIDLTLGISADSGGPSTVNTSQTLTISGTANEVETSVSSQTITVGLPDAVIVGTSLSAPTIKTATIQHSSGAGAATIDSSGNIVAAQNFTVNGNLFVNGSTTQVNTSEMTVYDRTITLGIQTGTTPSTTTWDLGILMNYGDIGVAKTAGVIWEYGNERFVFSANSDNPSSSNTSTPDITVATYAPIEIGALWVNDCAGQSQVISCTGTERFLENITVDAGTF